ncbi:N-6 DNA methylase [Kocuria sp. NPDC057446]|uniref:N-6 DNA methylase n=1 Tax=Kocuria sp. NPDC057446 TaxID=3346137 RepID=UPI0036C7BCC5
MTTTGLSLNKAQIAELGGVSRPAAAKWVKDKDFPKPVPGLGTPNSPRYRAEEVRAWMKANGKKIVGDDAPRALWAAMNAWRDYGLDYREGVNVVTSLIVWRYVSDPTSPGFYEDLPAQYHWQSWRDWATSHPLAEIEEGMNHYERETNRLGLFDSFRYSSVARNPRDLKGSFYAVLDALGMITLDEFTKTFEAFYDRVAEATGKTAGEFATSKDLIDLAARAVADVPGPVYDPVAGTGRLLLVAMKEGINRSRVTGQEITRSSHSMALQRALLWGVDNFDVHLGDTLADDTFPEGHAQAVVMNPPYGVRNPVRDLTWDPRFIFGAPKRMMDLAWPQIGIWHLGAGGRCVCYLPSSCLFRGGDDARIRQAMLKAGSVEAIVALPAGMAIATSIPLTMWVLARPGEAADPSRVLLIDQTDQGERLGRTAVTVDTAAIAEALQAWRGHQAIPEDMPAAAVSVEELLATGGNLTPQQWMQSSVEAPEANKVREQIAALDQATMELAGLQRRNRVEVRARTAPVAQATVGQLIKEGRIEQVRPKYRVPDSDLSDTEGLPVVTGAWIRREKPIDKFVNPLMVEAPVVTRPGDVLVQILGGLNARVDEEGDKVLHTSTYSLLRVVDDNLDPEYLAEIIATEHNWNSYAQGISHRRVKIADLPVPLLPRVEQEALVAVLTEAHALIEGSRALAAKAQATRNVLAEAVAAGALQVDEV